MTGLTVDTDVAADEDLFGKVIGDLQANVSVGSEGIGGTLKFINDYSAAGYTGDEKSGNFLVVHASVPEVEGVTIVAEIIGGVHGPVTLDADGILISRIRSTTQMIKFTASKTGYPDVTRIFRLNGLRLISG